MCITNLSSVVLDFKNNLLKEKAHMNPPPKVIDLDKGNTLTVIGFWSNNKVPFIPFTLTLIYLPAEMQKFSKWGDDERRVELGSLAGPEAALQTLTPPHCPLSLQETQQERKCCEMQKLTLRPQTARNYRQNKNCFYFLSLRLIKLQQLDPDHCARLNSATQRGVLSSLWL